MVVALAGRRIDAEEADESRFPLRNVELVRERLRALFKDKRATVLVCAGACGADLIALELAGELDMERWMVLPGSVSDFRKESVIDRPGDWGRLYDRIINELGAHVEIRSSSGEQDDKYLKGNDAILNRASELANQKGKNRYCVIAWDGKPRGEDDITHAFKQKAESMGFVSSEISTLDK